MARSLLGLVTLALLVFTIAWSQEPTPEFDPNHYKPAASPCYNSVGLPQRCVPDFINAAFNLHVEATDTCGEREPTSFCVQTGHIGVKKVCDECDARVPELAHPATYLTDFNNPEKETWWQSRTMMEGMQYPTTVNLTIRLGKSFDITYVRLKFISPRPESFIIYKKTHLQDDWVPWQYYSGSCRTTFNLPDKAPILPGNEAVAQCTREFSDISPLTGGNIAFSTLEGRPSAEAFEESEVLHSWVTATAIRISLVRMNSYGDEIFRDPRVLKSYYYAISDFAVGGRCKCNGHASECTRSTGQGAEQLVCNCMHNTTGAECSECEPFFVDRPWRSATSSEANECLPCNCNGLSRRCYFDQKMFDETGSGGVCIDCAGNTQGPHCESCAPNHWRRPRERHCTPCQCNEVGSENQQCDENGQCPCKPGVGGQFCDRCLNGFYDFGQNGCQDCHCEVAGSANNVPLCSPADGQCQCKSNVEGQKCDRCKPGFFNLALSNEYGCSPCFCYGHSSVCSPADGFFAYNETSTFTEGIDQFTAGSDARPEDVQWASLDKAVAVSQLDNYPVFFFAPKKFIGDQRFVYNQDLSFTLRVQQAEPPKPSIKDIVLVGANGQELTLPINAQNNPVPSSAEQNYHFHIHSNPTLQWNPRLREVDFIGVLSNLTAIKIRGTYSNGDVGFLSNFKLGTAGLIVPEGVVAQPADWVETCQCAEGFVGQFCESCAPGFKRAFQFGGPLVKCVPCTCNDHSDSCDPESGVCICGHNTAGDDCSVCARGYYGNAVENGEDACKKCDCPENGPCMLLNDGDTICTECPLGYTGRKCDSCADEHYGDPANGIACIKCDCNGNVDPNSIGNCDSVSGVCTRCVYNTAGDHCEKCSPGYWGDATAQVKGDCKPCNCFQPGTRRPSNEYEYLECQQDNGQCDCLPNVIGERCSECQPGYYNITSGTGCQTCECDPIGSLNTTCDLVTGQCQCKPGVTGKRCDMCAPYFYGFSSEGCVRCDCDQIGSESLECDVNTGQCLCKDNIEGRRCDQCSENRYDLRRGCLACSECYDLIQSRKNQINSSIATLRDNLSEIQNNPVKVEDSEFDSRVQEVRKLVSDLHAKAAEKLDNEDAKMIGRVNEVKDQVTNVRKSTKDIDSKMNQIDDKSAFLNLEIQRIKSDKDSIEKEIDRASEYLNREGQNQLKNAQNAANRLGDRSQQLSEFAEESTRLVAKQEQQKAEIEKYAESATTNSKNALNEANEAIYGASTISQQIATLDEQLRQTTGSFNQIEQTAGQVTNEANDAHNAAALALSNVEGAKFPDVVPEDMNEEAQNQKEESMLSATDAKEKIEENRQSLEDSRRSLAEADKDLQKAKDQQELAINALRDLEAARNRSRDAFDLGTKIWNDAEASLTSLNDFNENMDSRKEEALRHLEKLSDIQQQIDDARQTTAAAEADIGSAKLDAEKAQKLAEKARDDAENIAKQTKTLKNETAMTKEEAAKQTADLDKLVALADSLDSTTKDFENQAATDAEKSAEILRKAILADTNAKQLQNRLNESETQLNHALTLLNSLEDVNDEQLTNLESLLNEAEKQYAEAALDKLVKEEVVRKTEQDKTQLKREVDNLNKQLENLRSIYEALPNRCYNLVNLEQEGQK